MTRKRPSTTGLQLGRARALRQDMTDAERHLWYRLRAGRVGVHFRRQTPFGPYIVDFACIERRLIVEIDGGQHAEPEQAAYDSNRTAYLEGLGFRVLRFWNNEVLGHTEGVLMEILRVLGEQGPPSPPLPPAPSPSGGGGVRGDHRSASSHSNLSPPPEGEGSGERGRGGEEGAGD